MRPSASLLFRHAGPFPDSRSAFGGNHRIVIDTMRNVARHGSIVSSLRLRSILIVALAKLLHDQPEAH